MQIAKQILEKAGIKPKLQLGVKTDHGVVPTGPHTVKLIKDKEVMGTDEKGIAVPMVRFLVEENGELKTYDVRKFKKGSTDDIHYLVQKLAGYSEGSVVILEMKKKGIKNYIDVIPTGESSSVEVEEDDVDIPIINADESEDTK